MPLQKHSIYPVAVEDLYLHYKPSLSLYWILPMYFTVEYSSHIGLYQIIHYQVMIGWIETMVQCWEYEVEIQTLMKGHSCYTTRGNAEVTLRHFVVVVPVSTYTHHTYIHKYCDFHSWWTTMACYLTDQVKFDQMLKKLATHA